jgi:hypothetical protein
MLLALFIAATIYAIHHDCERRIKHLKKASGRKSGSANERAATAQRELDAARAIALFDQGFRKRMPRRFPDRTAGLGDYGRYDNRPRYRASTPACLSLSLAKTCLGASVLLAASRQCFSRFTPFMPPRGSELQ